MDGNTQKIIPPYNLDAEQSVLGSMILDKEAIAIATETLKGEDFYADSHRTIFEAILELYDKGAPVDLITLVDYLRKKDVLKATGDVTYITSMADSIPSTANMRYYVNIIQDKSILRKLIKASNQILNESYKAAEDTDCILDNAEKCIFDISQKRSNRSFIPINEALLNSIDRIEKLYLNQGNVSGISTGFSDVDRKTSGFQNSDFILLAARPSMGKTALALNIAQHAAIHNKMPVAIFSLEMSCEQLVNRMLCAEANVDFHRVRTGNLNEEDWDKLVRAAGYLSDAPIFIDDTPGITVTEIRSKARRLKLEKGVGLIIIDYLQLMQGRSRTENRQQEISDISRSLKGIARELDIPVLTLSQLSRAPEARSDHHPMLSDLRESGAIEQDADLVMFLYRDEYYNKDTDKKNIAELIIAKQRNGPTGTVELFWMEQFTKFADLEKYRDD